MPATRYPLHTPALPALGQLLRSAASRIAAGLQRWLDRERRRRAAHAARSLLYALDDRTATAVYGLYISATYIVCLPGGWIADRLIGAQRAVVYGGLLLMALAAGVLYGVGPYFAERLVAAGLAAPQTDSNK